MNEDIWAYIFDDLPQSILSPVFSMDDFFFILLSCIPQDCKNK